MALRLPNSDSPLSQNWEKGRVPASRVAGVRAGLLLLTLLLTLPAFAAPPKTAKPKIDPTTLPTEKAQNLVETGKVFAFYDPKDLGKPPVLSAKSAALIDMDTGEILWQKNGNLRRYPASTTKIMTGLLLAENTQPTDVITCTDTKIKEIEESSLHIQPWEKFTSKDLLYGTMLRSANDGSVVIAEHIDGSVAQFAIRMNERARTCGATDTHFNNPNGLPDKQHWTTAHDLALIAREAMLNDRFRDAVSQPKRTISRSKAIQDSVVASKAKKFYATFPGADGIKTGYTRAARNCFVGSATRNGRRLIGVIMGANSNASGEAMPLLGWGFRRFPAVPIAQKDAPTESISVQGGTAATVATVAGRTFNAYGDALLMNNGASAVTTELRPATVSAPVVKGQQVAQLVVLVNGKERGVVPILAAEDVAATPLQSVRAKSGGKVAWFGTGAGVLLLVALGYGTASAKVARRRRNRVPPPRRGDNRPGSSQNRR